MPPIRQRAAEYPKRIVAFIDSYWFLGRSSKPDHAMVSALNRAVGQDARVERIYWYLEVEEPTSTLANLPRVSIRTVSRDDLDDGYDLIRAMEVDIRATSISQRFDSVLVASQDDRLALTLEWVKAQGLLLLGCASAADETDPRMQRIVDELIEIRFDGANTAMDDVRPATVAVEVIDSAIGQWFGEVDAEERDRTVQYMEKRPGLPRPIDSRPLFIARKKLERELSQGERVTLRRRFRETILPPHR